MKINNGFKKFVLKFLLVAVPACVLYISLCYYTDINNVFHPETIRVSGGTQNQRFLKMKYILEHPERYDALIFGSSRAGKIPPDYLTNNTDLNWYNMFYHAGLVKENLKDIEILIENNVPLKKIIVVFDDTPLWYTQEINHKKLVYRPYSEYIDRGKLFYLPYLTQFDINIMIGTFKREVITERFYGNGSSIPEDETFLPGEETEDFPAYRLNPYSVSVETVLEQLRTIKTLCDDNGIEVIFITNPIWKNTFIEACDNGYLDILKGLADITPYINFSCLNEITTDSRNYFEGSHYRPNVGLLMSEILCNTSDRAEELASSQFGVWVTQDNVDSVIDSLHAQLDSLYNE